jgi:hypothetical protein
VETLALGFGLSRLGRVWDRRETSAVGVCNQKDRRSKVWSKWYSWARSLFAITKKLSPSQSEIVLEPFVAEDVTNSPGMPLITSDSDFSPVA